MLYNTYTHTHIYTCASCLYGFICTHPQKCPSPKINIQTNTERRPPTYTQTQTQTLHTLCIYAFSLCAVWMMRKPLFANGTQNCYIEMRVRCLHNGCTGTGTLRVCCLHNADGLAVGENFPIICSHLSRLGHLRAYLSGLGQEGHIFQCLQHRLPPSSCKASAYLPTKIMIYFIKP